MASWKEIPGYEGLYLVSSDGDIVALPKKSRTKSRLMKPCLRGRDYLKYQCIRLTKDGKGKIHSVHRLVAEAFLPNPEGLPEVNHKDRNPMNNRVDNLEWCTRQYNIEYSKNKAVLQITGGAVVNTYDSITHASDITGINRRSISNALTGWAATAGGYQWKYATE